MSVNAVLVVGTTSVEIPYRDLPGDDRFFIKRVVSDFCRKKLTTYDFNQRVRRFVRDKEFFKFDPKLHKYVIPTAYLDKLKEYFDDQGVTYTIRTAKTYRPKKHSFSMNKAFTDRPHQLKSIEFLSDKNRERCGLSLHTGGGKTYIATKAAYNLGTKTMVVCGGLTNQWYDSLSEQTTLGENIYIVQGFPSLKKLFKQDLKPDVLICSIGTLRPYIQRKGKYANLPPYSEMIKKFGIGVKIVDEAHLCFHASCQVDLAGCVPHNIYLTATFEQTSQGVRKIFAHYYPDQMRYGGEGFTKYITSTFYAYNGIVPDRECSTSKGYSHPLYERFLLDRPAHLFAHIEKNIIPIIWGHYINKEHPPGKKMLIFCATEAMINAMCTHIQSVFKDLKVLTYLYSDSDDNLIDGDIILSTHKGAGTGTDIAGLMCELNTVSFKSPVTAKQIHGRLRKPADDSTPDYVDMMDVNNKAQVRHYYERHRVVRSLSKKYYEYRI